MASRAAILRAARAGAPGAAQPTYPPQGGSPWIGQLPSYATEPGSGYSRPYGPFLPRPGDVFTQGAFGPLAPILPVPVDQPPPGFERAQPRRWQPYPGYNLPVGQPGTEGYKLASFDTLKTLAETYSILRTCIEIRKNEIRALDWDILPTREAAKKYQGDRAATQDFEERRAKAKRFMRRPDPNYYTFESWLHAMMDQVFTIDALSLYMCPKKGRGLGRGLLGSDLDCLWLINGASIRPLMGLHGEVPEPSAPGYQQYEFGVPRADLTMMEAGLDLNGDEGRLLTEIRGDQLMYHPYLQRVDSPYGFSLVEQALIPIMTGLRKQAYQLDYFSESSVPRVWLSPGDASMTPNQIRELQDAINAVAGDLAWAFKVMVVPPNSKIIPQKDISIVDDSDNWIATEVAMVCCTMGTDVLTRQGLRAIEDISPGDHVMTHRGRWQPVTRVMRSAVGERDVRRIEAHGFDPLEVTSDHPVWTARYHRQGTRARQYQGTEFLPAGELRAAGPRGDFDTVTLPVPVMGSADSVLRPVDHVKGRGRYKVWEENGRLRHTRRDVQTLPAEVPMGAALGRILGFYVAEGSVGTSQVFWNFHEDEVAYQQQVIDDLWSVFGLRAKVKPQPEGVGRTLAVVCQSPLLRDLLSCGTATTKSLPEWAWDGSPEFYASLLWAWVAGDGWIASASGHGRTRIRFDGWRGYTASRTLAWQMRMVALACGQPCSLNVRKQRDSAIRGRPLRSDRVIYALEMRRKINPARPGRFQIESGLHLTSSIRSNDVAPYEGEFVYNLEVGEDHSYVTTGGTVHNCNISPVELGLIPKVSSVASPFAAREMAQASRSIHERTSTKPTLSYVASIFDFLLQMVCGQEDMRFVFNGMEETQDQAALTDMLVKQVQSGLKSIDEARDDLHLTPWNYPETQIPLAFTQMGPIPLDEATQEALSSLRQAITGQAGSPQAQQAVEAVQRHAAVTGQAPRKALPAGTTGQGRMNGAVTQRQARRGGALAPAHATAEGSPGHSGASPPKAALAELEALGRHLGRGMPVSEWVPEHIPGHVMATIEQDMAAGLSAAYAVKMAASSLPKAPAAQSQQQRQQAQQQAAQRAQQAALAAQHAAQLQAAFGVALAAAKALIAAWIAGTLAVTAAVLVSMILAELRKAMLPVLTSLWTDAWQAGEQSAGAPEDQAALQAFLDSWGEQWLDVISATGAKALQDAIRQALASGDPAVIAQAVDDLLSDARADTITRSEFMRAWNAAVELAMRAAGLAYKKWVTSGKPNVCPICRANAAQGSIPLDKPFKSGKMRPLEHPNCECHLEPGAPPPANLAGKSRKVLRREVGLNGQEMWTEWEPQPETTGGRVFYPHRADGAQYTESVPGAMTGGEPPRWDGSEPYPVVERAPDADDDAEYGEAAGIGARPGTYWPAPYMDGWWPAPHGQGMVQPPTSSPGSATGRPPNAGGKRRGGDEALRFLRGAPHAKPGTVYHQMLGNFPPEALEWVKRIRWAGPVEVPLDLIDTSGRDKWAARHQQDHVDDIARQLQAKEPVNPGIGIVRAGHNHIRMIDGRHRLEACGKLGWPLRMYVGYLDAANEKAAYDTYLHQFHSGDDPANKSFTAGNLGLPGNVSGLTPFNLQGAPDRTVPDVAGLAVRAADTGRVLMIQRAITDADPAAGLWEFPGGHADTGEPLFGAACREFAEETGHAAPPGDLTGRWTASNGVYEGHVVTIPREDDLDLAAPREISNPDGDAFEAVAWWDPALLIGNQAIRPEILADLQLILAALNGVSKTAAAGVLADYWTHQGHPGPTQYSFEEQIGWGTPGDFDRCTSLLMEHGHMSEEQAHGYCNLRHHQALGYWPAQHAAMERGK